MANGPIFYRRYRSSQKNFKVGKALPNWGEHLPKDVSISLPNKI